MKIVFKQTNKKILVFLFIFSLFFTISDLYALESANVVYQRGSGYLKKGMYDEAITELSKAIQLNPRLDGAYYDRGRAYKAKGNLDQAIADYTKAIEINSIETIQSAYNNRGQAYEAKGDLDKALEDYAQGIEAVPNPTFSGYRYFKQVLHRNRAEIYLKRKEYDRAWEDVRAIEKMGGSVEPEFIDKLKNRSKENTSVSNPSATEKNPEKYPGQNNDALFYNNRGFDSYEKGEYDQAIRDYNRAIEINPNEELAYANRANAYAAKGDFDKAIADYNKALEINAKDFKVYNDLGLTYTAKGDFDEAVFYFNKALEINPDLSNDGQFHNDRAVAYFWKKEYDKCWDDVNKAIELGYRVHPQFLQELKKATGRER